MNKKGLIGAAKISLIFILLIFSIFFIYQSIASAEGSAAIWTTDIDGIPRTDFSPEEIVYIHGSDFLPNHNIDISITRPNGVVDTGSILTESSKNFVYEYELDGIKGIYNVVATDGKNTAITTFTDGDIDFTQCANDDNNDNVKENCKWVTGALNNQSSIYREGDVVPQRLVLKISDAGTHIVRFEYRFTKGDKYAYDFISTPNLTQTGSLLNACANRPGWFSLSNCNSIFSSALTATIPSDSFDAVSSRETPTNRNILIGGVSSPSVTIVGHDPSTNCFQNCGDSSAFIDVTFTTSSPNTIIVIWFGGHLAQGSDPDGVGPLNGWGTGFGSSSISGAPFHMRYYSFDGDSEGKRDNQIMPGAILPPPSCDSYTSNSSCEADLNCDWCPLCQYISRPTKTNQWLQAKCVPTGTDCGYHCEIGYCNATCDSDNQCPCKPDVCIGPDYYDYPDYGTCVDCPTSCYCQNGTDTGQPCHPTISYDDPRCGECQDDDDCNSLDKDYCDGTVIKHDEGRCIDYHCQAETTTVKECYYYEQYCNAEEVWYEEGFCNDIGPVCDYKTGFIEDCNNDYEFCFENQRLDHNGFCTDGSCDSDETIIEDCDDYNQDYCSDDYNWIHQTGTCIENEETSCALASSTGDCRDEYWCNGEETCSELGGVHCDSGTPIDCSGNNLIEIATCDWIPDKYHFTWDYAPGFLSVCDEDNDRCTESSYTYTHTCADNDIFDTVPFGSGCDAECDENVDCKNYCDEDIRYFNGGCDLGDCYCDYDSENCNDDDGCYVYGTGCEDRDYYCAPGECDFDYSNRHTDFEDEQEYYCSDSEIRSHKEFHDFYCNGACSDHPSWVDDELVEDCDLKDGWYDTGRTKWTDIDQCNEKEEKEREYRDYTCYENDIVECDYRVTDTQWIDTGKTRNKDDGTSCDDGLFCTDPDTCTAGVCRGPSVDCSDFTDQCNLGFCNEDNDRCEYAPKETSHPCDNGLYCDGPDHCDAEGAGGLIPGVCVNLGPSIDCSYLDDQCQEGICDETQDKCVADYSDYPESTPCEADDDLCTLDHCDGYGSCVWEEDVPVPSTPIKTIGEPKTTCSEEEWCEWRITTLTPIILSCTNGANVIWRYALDGEWKEWHNDTSPVTIHFPEESNHSLEAYCSNVCGNSTHDIEKFKVEGTAFEIPLYKKWNLISVPFPLLNSRVEEVFKNIKDNISSVWTYDNGVWYIWTPNDGPDTLHDINAGWGYWVLSKDDNIKIVIGGSLFSPVMVPPSKPLMKGWNLIGYYGTDWQEYDIEPDDCGYNPDFGEQSYCSLNSLIETSFGLPRWSSLETFINCGDDDVYWSKLNICDFMYAGKGYWIFMLDENGDYAPATNCIWNEKFKCI